jgi:threonine/homoserine/homoserine lactone efflux protein
MKGVVVLLAAVIAAVNFSPIIQPILEVLNAILWPTIAVVGSAGAIYCVFLGIKIAKSDEQNSREKAKKDLLGAVIGFALIFILIVALKIAMPILQDWVRAQV